MEHQPRTDMPQTHAGEARARREVGSVLLGLQRSAGNRATALWVAGAGGAPAVSRPGSARGVQRLAIYGRAAAPVSALPARTVTTFRRQVAAGNPTLALTEVVIAMTTRGELQPRLLQTSGGGDLWRISDLGEEGAVVTFQSPFPDPADPARRLPNPRFEVSRRLLSPGSSGGLVRLHTSLLHEFRHVQQAAERVNARRGPGSPAEAPRPPGYGTDPNEFDAYLSEVELSYDTGHMFTAALQAGVHWGFLADSDRTPFRARWRAAQARAERVLGFTMTVLMASDPAGRYREQIRARDARAREAWERAGRRSGAGGGAPPGGAPSAGHRP